MVTAWPVICMVAVESCLLETLRNKDGIEEDNVLDNATYLTVSQCFNQNLKSLLYLSVLWLNSPVLFTFLQRKIAYSDDF